MSDHPIIQVAMETTSQGSFQTTAWELDEAIEKYLPASPKELRAIIEDRTSGEDYSEVTELSALVIVLAVLDGEVR